MSKIILDSTALLAFLNDEPGSDIVEERLPEAIMSSVNVSEVASVMAKVGVPQKSIKSLFQDLSIKTYPFDDEQALAYGDLNLPECYDLPFADRACFALAQHLKLPVMTADEDWRVLDLNIRVLLIR